MSEAEAIQFLAEEVHHISQWLIVLILVVVFKSMGCKH